MEYEKPRMSIFELESRDVFMTVSPTTGDGGGFSGNDNGDTSDGF